MKCEEIRIHFDGVIVDVKLSFHRRGAGRFADGGGRAEVLSGMPAAEGVGISNNGGYLKSIQKWASGFRRSTICRVLFDE